MASSWYRTHSFDRGTPRMESWTRRSGGVTEEFPVRVHLGKPIRIDTIKSRFSFRNEFEASERVRLSFEERHDRECVEECPVCAAAIEDSSSFLVAWGAEYRRCGACEHLYLTTRLLDPSHGSFSQGILGGVYTTPAEIELRIREIYAPKVTWAVETFKYAFGSDPQSLLEIGAGAGHLVKAARSAGLDATGIEESPEFVEFAREYLGVGLLERTEAVASIVYSGNRIEHVRDVNSFIAANVSAMSDRSLLVIETPNGDSFTAHLQQKFPHRIRGFLTPYEHTHLFTLPSLLTVCRTHGLRPVGYWSYGDDARELLFQASEECDASLESCVSSCFSAIQTGLDAAALGNFMMVAFVRDDAAP